MKAKKRLNETGLSDGIGNGLKEDSHDRVLLMSVMAEAGELASKCKERGGWIRESSM